MNGGFAEILENPVKSTEKILENLPFSWQKILENLLFERKQKLPKREYLLF